VPSPRFFFLRRSCCNGKCRCASFFFVVAEGSWTLRCRCKHKAVEHDAVTHACAKAGCGCAGFGSPWVCNCDHPWASHRQVVVDREVKSVAEMMAEAAAELNPLDAVQRGV
jgi:hypothetical protein